MLPIAEASCDANDTARLDVALSSALVQRAAVANSAKLGKSAASAYELVADSRAAICAACVAISELVVANCELREDVALASDALSSVFAAATAELSSPSVAYPLRSVDVATAGHTLLHSPARQSSSVAVVEAFWYATLVMVEVAVPLRIES